MAEIAADHGFTYATFTQRNIGFVSAAEQALLKDARIFVCGTGGMGGACINALVRAGVGHLTIADIDTFEVSNLNRQVFAFRETIGRPKAEATLEICHRINPEVDITVLGREWTDRLPELARTHRIIVNGMDHIPSGIHLYRTARDCGATVIDAYTSSLPSVTVVRPGDPRPEQRLGFSTAGKVWTDISAEDQAQCLLREIEYVMTHSTTAQHIDLDVAAQVAAGKRSRMSFAPMVITAGNMMAYEAIQLALGRRNAADYRGYFFNPYRPAVERPRPAPVAWVLSILVRRYLKKLLAAT